LISQDYAFEIKNIFNFSFKGQDNFTSAWFRRTKLPNIEGATEEERLYLLGEYDALIQNILSSIDCNWLSEPRHIYFAENKTVQLRKAKELGFKVPSTLVTNDKNKVKLFYERNNGNIIIKPISRTRIDYRDQPAFIFTNVLTKDVVEALESFEVNPCILQENIKKKYEIRATVVGDKVFAASVDSQKDEATKVDWRRKKLDFKETELPKLMEQRCVQLVKELNLGFGALDLIKTEEDEYYFLELNPNGQWAWIELQTGQKISEAIINLLT
jgi:glutathione synthase/RimK-type ligase-like ATP-grasp enzyme